MLQLQALCGGYDPMLVIGVIVAGIFAYKFGLLDKLKAKATVAPAQPASVVRSPAAEISGPVLALLAEDERRTDQEAAAKLIGDRRRARETEALEKALQRRKATP